MKYFIIIIIVILTFLGSLLFFSTTDFSNKNSTTPQQKEASAVPQNIIDNPPTEKNLIIEPTTPTIEEGFKFASPLERASERITKKKFGQFITPQNSPIQPENFSGYHTGTDFEIFPEELNTEVSVYAVCEGKLKEKKYATGYGGVVVQSCELNSSPVTVVYGHLKLASVAKDKGKTLKIGELVGFLGVDKSTETSGERKHLHLGVHKSTTTNILGYVQTKNELSAWVDPCLFFCK